MRFQTIVRIAALGLSLSFARAGEIASVANEKWFSLQTPNFTVLTSGPIASARQLALKLEQFREAYSALAGAGAVAAAPIIIVAFQNNEAFRPFQPLYEGQPVRVGGFFQGDYDENLIALNLQMAEASSMDLIFHEYIHLLLRRHDRVWPLWLKEGVAEVYSSFTVENNRVCLGTSKARHVEFLRKSSMLPLGELFGVKNNSPQYNERDQRGIFYAESWLVTHYLALNPKRKAQFQTFTRRLREGIPAENAFTNSFQTSLAALQKELEQYLSVGKFNPVCYDLGHSVETEKPLVASAMPPVEVVYQLGNLLLHCRRLDEAEPYFLAAQQLAPTSPRSYDGLGLLAARKRNFPQAIAFFEEALARRSGNYRVHYEYARAILTTGDDQLTAQNLSTETAAKVRSALQRAVQLAPRFAPAHYLLGVSEAEKDGNSATRQFQIAMQLDPEAKHYSIALAQLQIRRREFVSARQTLSPLLASQVEPRTRREAERMMKSLEDEVRRRR